jgi:SAM-dependent methyltransferase
MRRGVGETGLTFPPCPVCAAPYTAYVRNVPALRSGREVTLYACLDCRSFFNPSGYQETDEQLAADVKWGLSVADRNRNAAGRLFKALAAHGVKPKRIVDIGCSTGTMLDFARSQGIEAIGFDVNPYAIEHARGLGLDARKEFWTAATSLPPVDLFLCIMVLEHMEEPRPVIAELCKGCLEHKAAVFISVPFIYPRHLPALLAPDPTKVEGSVFMNADVHVTHFSREGLARALAEFGLQNQTFVEGGLWHGWLARG